MDCVYARNDSFVFRLIGEEAILVPVYGRVADMESIYTLSEVGARIWELVDGRRTLAELRDAIVAEYDAPPDQIEADLVEFVDDLVAIEALRPA